MKTRKKNVLRYILLLLRHVMSNEILVNIRIYEDLTEERSVFKI